MNLALSVIAHKEVRFIYPLLPILTVLAAPHAAAFFAPSRTGEGQKAKAQSQTKNTPYLLAALAINGILAFYLATMHQSGVINVMTYIRTQYETIHPDTTSVHQAPDKSQELFALFLMPCHSTPWRSHLLYPSLQAYALSCEPPLHTEPNTPERDNYRDEADRFYDDPLVFLQGELFAKDSGLDLPRYIAGFEGIEPLLKEYFAPMEEVHLTRVWDGFNGFFSEDWRRAGKVVVWDTGVYPAVF